MPTNIGAIAGPGAVLLPAGGSAGQALTKTATATGWASAYPGGPPVYTSGLWYDNRYTASGNTTSTIFSPGGSLYVPLFLHRPVVINALGLFGNGSGNAELGAYTMTASNFPGTLLGSVVVPVPASAAAFTGAVSLTLPAGWSFLAVAVAANLTYYYCSQAGSAGPSVTPWSPVAGTGTPISTGSTYSCWSSGGTNLPATPAVTSLVGNAPTMFFRAA